MTGMCWWRRQAETWHRSITWTTSSRYYSLSLTHLLTQILSLCIRIHSLISVPGRKLQQIRFRLTHSLTHSLTYVLTHSLTHLLTHSLTHLLVVHFTINDIKYAEKSVDDRMQSEISAGRRSLASGNIKQVVAANAGGPYASSQLKKVQEESDHAIKLVFDSQNSCWDQWYKARIYVDGHEAAPWNVRATK